MRNLWNLMQGEYKKMLCKKSILILVPLAIIFTIFRYTTSINDVPGGISGVSYFFELTDTTILMIFLITSICIGPLFAEEYTTRVDQLILSAKYGKNRLIWAKISVGISVAVGLVCIFFLASYISTLVVKGFETTTSEEWRLLGIYCMCALVGNIFSSVICMYFSARLKSSYSTLVVCFLLIILSRMLQFPESFYWGRALAQLLPLQMASIATICSSFMYHIGGMQLAPYQLIPIVAICGSLIIVPMVYRTFKEN
ncbi:MAG: ABC transporter permease [Cellulosilyticaceae bacterium]